MKNPWEEIQLSDYENHMKLHTVMQQQCLNAIMKKQFDQYRIKTVMVLGVAGGNGLEHIDPKRIEKIYGVDINQEYLTACAARYQNLSGVLECLHADVTDENTILPYADLVIADLFIEYVGYPCFENVLSKIKPKYVSAVIQLNTDDSFVSDSPYLHVFDRLDRVHHQMDESSLSEAMNEIHYQWIVKEEHLLPNGKKLVQLDYRRGGAESMASPIVRQDNNDRKRKKPAAGPLYPSSAVEISH
jgi:hypothetical protein